MYASFNARAIGLGLAPEETVQLAAEAGFSGVDLLIRDLVDGGTDPAELRARMDDLGLRGGAWPLPVDWKGDAERFARDLERLPRYAEAAEILGLFRTGTWVLPETHGRPGAGEDPEAILEATASWHLERLAAMAHVLEPYGSRIGLEVIGVESFRTGNGRPFVCRLGDIDARLGAIWSLASNVGILLDVHHLYAAGESIEAGLAWGVDRLVWVHVADLPASAPSDRHAMRDDVRGLPGEHGAIDCRGFLKRLAVEGYDGPVTVEPLAACRSLSGLDPKAKAHAVAASLRSVWPNEGVL